MGIGQHGPALRDWLCSHSEADSLTAIEMPPQALDLISYAAALRTYAHDFAPGSPIAVPRERLLALLEVLAPTQGNRTGPDDVRDHRIPELVRRLGRKPSTIRQMCAVGEFDMPTLGEGAYKNRGKEWMVPDVAVLAYEARQRAGGRPVPDRLSDWKITKSSKPRRKRAAQARDTNLLAGSGR